MHMTRAKEYMYNIENQQITKGSVVLQTDHGLGAKSKAQKYNGHGI